MTVRASIKQLDQLTRVLVLRVSHTTRAYQQQKTVVEEQQRNVMECRQEVLQLDRDRERVVRYLHSPDSSADPIKLSDAGIRRRWLAYDREKADYYLSIALDDLAEAEADLAVKKKAWLKAQARESQTLDQRRNAIRLRNLEKEDKELQTHG